MSLHRMSECLLRIDAEEYEQVKELLLTPINHRAYRIDSFVYVECHKKTADVIDRYFEHR